VAVAKHFCLCFCWCRQLRYSIKNGGEKRKQQNESETVFVFRYSIE